ncbi:MAG: hypothetical protein H6811_07680 [Phycisphaeraceae bacterium]|nr:hypothetical protein [Phycisphaeraceae bacterium]
MHHRALSFVAVAALAGSVASAQNVLANDGFESGVLSPWFADSGSPFITTAEAHSGTFSCAAFGSDSIRQDFAPIAASSITEVSIWVKRASGAFDQYTFYYDDGSDGTFLINDIGGGDDWKLHDLTANLDLSKNLSGFSIYGTSAGPAYFDDVTITPAPASMALLGVGGLLAARRRR